MAENKFVCPKCGGKLYYWAEEIIEKQHKVNPNTGKVNKTFTKKAESYTDHRGFKCEDCGWLCNTVYEVDCPDYLESIDLSSVEI